MGKKRRRPNFKPYAVGRYRLGWLIDQFCVVWWDDGARRRHRLGVAEEEAARTELHAFARAHLKLSAEAVETVKAFYEQYCADRESEGKSARRARAIWSLIGPVFGPMRPIDIDRKACRNYEAARQALGRKPHTIRNELVMLRTLINWAAKAKLLRLDDMPRLYVPPMPPGRDRHLTRTEVIKLIASADMPHIRLFIILAIATAGRMKAILDLKWNRVDFERGLIHLHDPERQATNKRRALVPMNATARAALAEARKGAVTDHVIEWAGKRVLNVKRGISTALIKAGLKVKQDGAHLLRHTAAVLMVESGVPIPEVAQYLGHTDLRTTYQIYARYSPDYLRQAATALDLPAVHLQVSDRRSR